MSQVAPLPTPTAALGSLVKTIRRRFGLDFGGQRFPLLLEGLSTHGRDPEHVAAGLLAEGPARLARFIEQLANHETYFLRHPMQLEAIRSHVLSEAREAQKRGRTDGGSLQAWCAGCSTGEEPLSLAITLLEARERGGPEQFKILATDLSSAALTRARTASYGEWSFRGVPDAIRERYFRRSGQTSTPLPMLKAPIAFEHHNLLRGPPGNASFDLVLCRNVLIYFDPPSLDLAFATFREAVNPGGLLVLGPAEGAARIPPGFSSVDVDGVILYQRDDPTARSARKRSSAPRPAGLPDPRPSPPPRHRPPVRDAFARSAERRAAREAGSPTGEAVAPAGAAAAGELPPFSPLVMARLAADQGRLEDARGLLRGHPESTEALVILALVELESENLEDAAEALDQLLAVEAENLMGSYLMGRLLQALGRKSAADEWYRKALEGCATARNDELLALGGALNREEFAQVLTSLLASSPDPAGGPR